MFKSEVIVKIEFKIVGKNVEVVVHRQIDGTAVVQDLQRKLTLEGESSSSDLTQLFSQRVLECIQKGS